MILSYILGTRLILIPISKLMIMNVFIYQILVIAII